MRLFLKTVFWANLLVIFSFWFQGSSMLFTFDVGSVALALGRIFGLTAVYLVLVQLLLIGRVSFVEQTFGHDKLARIHHKVGKFIICFLGLHVSLILLSYALVSSQTIFSQLVVFLTSGNDLLKAFIAFNLFLLIAVTSIWMKKLRLPYEAWFFIHLMVYVAILFAFGHQMALGGDFVNDTFVLYWYALYASVLFLFFIFRFGRIFYYFFLNKFTVVKVVPENDDVTSIYIAGDKVNSFPVKPGQFMIFRFLDKSRFWQAHPFSLSQVVKDNLIRISVKNSGDFTSSLHNVMPGTRVLVDGPLGIFISKVAIKDKFLFIAGGIGITPIRSMMEELSGQGKDMILIYSNKTKRDIVFNQELSKFGAKIYHFLTEEKAAGDYIQGRIDKENIGKLVPDIVDREIYLCGPKEFMAAITLFLVQLNVPEEQIHFEKFSLH
jgi:predicted ferric reductase